MGTSDRRSVRAARIGVAALAPLSALFVAGCSLAPKETGAERDRLAAVASEHQFETPAAQRKLPEFPESPTWRDALHRAFIANGDLEAAYFEWKASLERVDMASSWPNSNVSLGYEYMFSSERMKTFDRQTISLGFDAMENLQLPVKVRQAGKVALSEAQTTGERFRSAKFGLQRRVLNDWAELALLQRRIELAQEDLALLKASSEAAQSRLEAGGEQRDAVRALVALRMAENELANLHAERDAMTASLNAMIALPPRTPLATESLEMLARDVPSDDLLIAAGVDRNPQLTELARQVQGRGNALELARLQWIPDISPAIAFTGGASQAIGAMVSLPTTIAEIKGSIREGEAMLRAAEAMRSQAQRDQAGQLVAAILALRNQERQAQFERQYIIPAAQQLVDTANEQYAAGMASGDFEAVIDARRLLLEARVAEAQAVAAVAQTLAAIENLLGVDVETLTSSENEAESSPTTAEVRDE